MKRIYYLATCSTCKKILKSLNPGADVVLREIKSRPVSAGELDHLRALSGSYESLFSRRARKYKSMGLSEQSLEESDYRRLILQEYTFLKRPVIVVHNRLFTGIKPEDSEEVRRELHAVDLTR